MNKNIRPISTISSGIMGFYKNKDTTHRLEEHGPINDEEIVKALVSVMRQDAFNQAVQALDGRDARGHSDVWEPAPVAMVYGSTPLVILTLIRQTNSLFQDGVTISWLMGSSNTKPCTSIMVLNVCVTF